MMSEKGDLELKDLLEGCRESANYKAEGHFLAVGEIIAELEEERDRYKKALEEIMKEFSDGYDVGETAIEMYYIVKGAVKSETK